MPSRRRRRRREGERERERHTAPTARRTPRRVAPTSRATLPRRLLLKLARARRLPPLAGTATRSPTRPSPRFPRDAASSNILTSGECRRAGVFVVGREGDRERERHTAPTARRTPRRVAPTSRATLPRRLLVTLARAHRLPPLAGTASRSPTRPSSRFPRDAASFKVLTSGECRRAGVVVVGRETERERGTAPTARRTPRRVAPTSRAPLPRVVYW